MMLQSPFLGGSDYDSAYGVDVDLDNNVIVSGGTQSGNFPTPGGFDTSNVHGKAFLTVLDTSGQLRWGSLLGGSDQGPALSVAADPDGDALLTGWTKAGDFPTPSGFDTTHNGGTYDVFIAKIGFSLQHQLSVQSTPVAGIAITGDKPGTTNYTAACNEGQVVSLTAPGLATVGAAGYSFLHWSVDGVSQPDGQRTISIAMDDAHTIECEYVQPDQFYMDWASFLGGSSEDQGGIALDSNGNALITGFTGSGDLPTPNGFDTTYNGGSYDAFVAKVSPGGQLLWATFLGGGAADYGTCAAADAAGNIFVTGYTASSDFPTPGGGYPFNGYSDTWVVKLSPAGQLLWGSYLGGTGYDVARGIAVDQAGNVFIAGSTTSVNLQQKINDHSVPDDWETFVSRFNASGELLWTRYLGGSAEDHAAGLALDGAGNPVIVGSTSSVDFPTAGGFCTTYNGGTCDAFVAKLNAAGDLLWASFLGGPGEDVGYAIAVDPSGNTLVTGTTSLGFPMPGGFDDTFGGGVADAFVTKISPSCQLIWGTYLGGNDDDFGDGICSDSAGNVLVTGYTKSADFPLLGGFDSSHNGGRDAFVAKLTPFGMLKYATFLGGTGDDIGGSLRADGQVGVMLAGCTASPDFPTPNGSDTSYNGGTSDCFVGRLGFGVRHQLTVQSSPVTAVAITGDRPGTTNYTATCIDGQVVNLTAPASVTVEGTTYILTGWTVDGAAQPEGRATVQVTVTSDCSAVAMYQPMPTDGLTLWLEADAITGVSDGGRIPQWLDQSPNQISLLPSPSIEAAPRFIANGCNGLPVARFDGSSRVLEYCEGANLFAPDQATIFLVAKQDTSWPQGVVFAWSAPSGRVEVQTAPNLAFVHGPGGPENAVSVPQPPGWGDAFHLVECYRSGSFREIRADGLSEGTCTSAAMLDANGVFYLDVGSNEFSQTLKGDLAELLVYKRALSASERNQISSYLAAKYAVSYSPSHTLTVQSSPVPGIDITGDKPGTTDYTAACTVGEVVNLTAPRSTSVAGISYRFVQWVVDGLNQPDRQNNLSLTMNASHTAQAVFAAVNMLAYWDFEDFAGGLVRDLSGSGSIGHINNMDSSNLVAGKFGKAASFNGSDEWIRFDSGPVYYLPNGTTVELWVKATSQSSVILGKTNYPTCAGWVVEAQATGGTLRFGVGPGPGPGTNFAFASAAGALDGQWHHVAGTCDFERVGLYVDGVLVDSSPSAGNIGHTTAYMEMGRLTFLDSNYFAGNIDEAAIYDGALDADTIRRHFLYGVAGVPTLTVQSSPVTGISITGDRPGTTNYTATSAEGQVVSLTAPETVTIGGVVYDFLRWAVDGTPQQDGQATIELVMANNRGAEAQYGLHPLTLTVQSIPAAGIYISGDKPGTTNYKAACTEQEAVRLTAPFMTTVNDAHYSFLRWIVDGVDKPDWHTSVDLTMDADHTAVAVYEIQTYQLAVQSTPVTGVSIGGTKPGTTNYSATCDDQQLVMLTAPSPATVGGVRYDFVRWRLDGADQPAGEANLSVLMAANHTAVAVYQVQTHELAVQSLPFAGVSITGDRPGTTDYSVTCDDQTAVSLAAPERVSSGGENYALACWTVDGVLQPAGQATVQVVVDADRVAVANYVPLMLTLAVQSLPVTGVSITGDKPGTTDYSAVCDDGVTVSLTAPTAVTSAGLHYNFVRWTIDGVEQPPGEAAVAATMDDDHTVVAVYAIQTYTLSVVSTPIAGVSIGGDKPGTTGYSATCDEGQVVNLTAPNSAAIGEIRYNFVRWVLDGVDRAQGQTALQVTMDGAHVAAAAYQIQTYTLAVRSLPITGVTIFGDKPGATNYAAVCNDHQTISLTAPPVVMQGADKYAFVRWTVDGAGQPDGVNALQLAMLSDHTAEAVYVWQVPPKLTVQSVPVTGVEIGGNKPGTTDYEATCTEGETVTLTAPPTATVAGIDYTFLNWRKDGLDQPAGEASVSVVMDADHTATAVYEITRRVLAVRSTPVAGINIAGGKPGTTDYDAQCNDQESVTLTAPSSATVSGIRYNFVRWRLDSTDKTQGQMSLQVTMDADHTATAIYQIQTYGLVVRSSPIVGVMILGDKPGTTHYFAQCDDHQTVSITAPPVVMQGADRYRFVRWTVDGAPQTDGQTTLQITMLGDRTAIANYEIALAPQIAVQSTPVPGIAITGDKPGTTNYTAPCTDGETVSVSAPLAAVVSGAHYDFVRWMIDGVAQPDAQTAIQVTMTIDHTVIAVYQVQTHTLSVRSTPVTGIGISGNKPGATDYAAVCDDHQTVGLSAPALAMVGGEPYAFVNWLIDGVAEPAGQAAASITMDADREATAVYELQTFTLSVRSTPSTGIAITGDKPGATDYSEVCVGQTTVTLTAPLSVTLNDVIHDFMRWSVDGAAQPDGQLTVEVGMTADRVAVAMYDARMPSTLTVRSTPMAGVTISGDKPGTTEYSAVCDDGESVTITAPAAALDGIVHYNFVQWLVDGTPRTPGDAVLNIIMEEDHVATAAYEVQTHTLSVDSSPVQSVAIGGDRPGVTPYSASCADTSTVSLTAPPSASIGGSDYAFVRWTLDGAAQPDGVAAIQIVMNASHTAAAVYRMLGRDLTVQSLPVPGVEITGDAPGTTDYVATCTTGQQVHLAAPATAVVDDLGYTFVRWTVDGAEQPLGQASIDVTMDVDRTVVAVYQPAPTVLLRGPVERGEPSLTPGGGTFDVDLYLRNVPNVAGLQMALSFFDASAIDASFPISGPPYQIQFNGTFWGSVFDLSSDGHMFGFMSLSGNKDITDATWVYTITYTYDAEAYGAYSIVTDPQFTVIGSGSGGGIAFVESAGHAEIAPQPALSVSSTPVPGIAITGDKPGTTDYVAHANRNDVVELIAPLEPVVGGVRYLFRHWSLDGIDHAPGASSLQVTMHADHAAAAVYEIVKHTLTVSSIPITGIVIDGDKPGITDYAAACDDQQAVVLSAPPAAAVAGVGYRLARWTIDGAAQPDGQTDVTVTMDADHAAVAVYEQAPTLVLRGPADRGDDPPLSGGGTFVVDLLINTMPGFGGLQAGLDFFDAGGVNAGWLVSSVDGNPDFGGIKLEFNSAVWPQILALYVGDNETFGFISTIGDLDITAETWVFRVTYEYPPDALGTYTIATDPELTALGGAAGGIEFAEVAGTVTIAARRTLAVQSIPFSGVAIDGQKPGTTDYEAICFDGQTVSLTAPAEAVSPAGVHHEFVRWHVDGVAQPDAQAAIDVSMAAGRTAAAEYRVRSYPLHVQSEPFPGIAITGDLPGTTDYSGDCPHRQVVNLAAPAAVEVEGMAWNFLHWIINGVQQPNRELAAAITIDGETAAVAVYRQAPRLIFKGPQDRGEQPPVAGGGTFVVEVCLDAFYGFGGMQVGTSFIGPDQADAAFPVSMAAGNPDFGGMAVEFNSALWSNIMAIYTGDQRTVGFISLDSDIDIAEETWVFRITYEYGPEALGLHTIKAEPDLTALGGGEGGIAFREAAGTVRIVPRRTLAVQSSPITGVAIGGGRPGTTDYSALCIDQDVVSLQAPAAAADGAADYDFVRWTIDGVDQPDAQADVTITMTADVAAVAVYAIRTHELSVQSEPILGVEIGGHKPGTTAYTATCNDEQTVLLTAPLVALDGAVRYDFIRWLLDGIEQEAGLTDLTVPMSSSRAAVAAYAIRTHALTVQSTPIAGVAITGDKPGTTDYTATCDDQQIVALEAPDLVQQDKKYRFVRWHVDGSDEPAGLTTVAVAMDADHTAVAEYEVLTHTLTVQSVLVASGSGWRQVIGVPITGDAPPEFATNGTITCEDGQIVTLAAPRIFQMMNTVVPPAPVDYAFQRWAIDGVDQSWEYLSVQIEMRADHTLVAKYALACDANGDCRVNVLDLLRIRGALNQSVYTGDNWKMDVNGDKKVNVLDLIFARNKINKVCVK